MAQCNLRAYSECVGKLILEDVIIDRFEDYKNVIIAFMEQAFQKGIQEAEARIIAELWKLNWIKIMNTAINSRKTSWSENPIIEWRNASDEVNSAVVNALREKLGIKNPFEKAKEELTKKIKEIK